MDFLTQVINFTIDHYEIWIAYLASSTSVALIVQLLKKKYRLDEKIKVWAIDAKKFITLLLGFVSGLTAIVDVIITNSSGQAIISLLPQAAELWSKIVLIAIVIHRFLISDTWRRLDDGLRSYYAPKPPVLEPPVDTTQLPPPPTFSSR